MHPYPAALFVYAAYESYAGVSLVFRDLSGEDQVRMGGPFCIEWRRVRRCRARARAREATLAPSRWDVTRGARTVRTVRDESLHRHAACVMRTEKYA